jgi:hypothetical protein
VDKKDSLNSAKYIGIWCHFYYSLSLATYKNIIDTETITLNIRIQCFYSSKRCSYAETSCRRDPRLMFKLLSLYVAFFRNATSTLNRGLPAFVYSWDRCVSNDYCGSVWRNYYVIRSCDLWLKNSQHSHPQNAQYCFFDIYVISHSDVPTCFSPQGIAIKEPNKVTLHRTILVGSLVVIPWGSKHVEILYSYVI